MNDKMTEKEKDKKVNGKDKISFNPAGNWTWIHY